MTVIPTPSVVAQPVEIDFQSLGETRLAEMRAAADCVLECYRILEKTDSTVVSELLKFQGDFLQWDHYPAGDVYDWESHSQYYYHAHPPENRANVWGVEHGHFHTFLRPKGMPDGTQPADIPEYLEPSDPDNKLTHFVAVSMNAAGLPVRLFTTNRWVTGEVWYDAETVIGLLDHFQIELTVPSWPVNNWLTHMLKLFRPQIEELLRRRDSALADWQARHPGENAYEDRNLEVTSICDITVEQQYRAIQDALA